MALYPLCCHWFRKKSTTTAPSCQSTVSNPSLLWNQKWVREYFDVSVLVLAFLDFIESEQEGKYPKGEAIASVVTCYRTRASIVLRMKNKFKSNYISSVRPDGHKSPLKDNLTVSP